MNLITIMGRLTASPELKYTNGATAVTSFTVAVDRDYKASSAERQTDFISCVAWRNTAEFITNYFHKGDMIALQGSLQSRSWQDTEGNKRTVWEVLVQRSFFCGKKGSNQASEDTQSAIEELTEEEQDDGDLPF